MPAAKKRVLSKKTDLTLNALDLNFESCNVLAVQNLVELILELHDAACTREVPQGTGR